jgi:DNA-binding MurR/RpiR family transcriptional regulator
MCYGMSKNPVAGATLAERVAAAELAPAERRVAVFFTEHGEEAAFLSAAEIGERLGTSDATVVRTVKALGYAGLAELRRELAETLRARASPALRLGRSLEAAGDDPAAVFDHVLAQEAEFVQLARERTAPAAVRRAVEVLRKAGRVACAGVGPAGSLCEYAALRLARFGRPTLAITETGIRLADRLQELRRGDALLLLAHQELEGDGEQTLRRANDLELPVVLVTDTLGPRLEDRVEASLSAPRSAAGAFGTNGSTLALLDALLLAYAAAERPRALGALAELDELRARLRG